MTSTETAPRTATLLLKSGGTVQLTNPINFGRGIAGDIAGGTKWFADKDIAEVIEHPNQADRSTR